VFVQQAPASSVVSEGQGLNPNVLQALIGEYSHVFQSVPPGLPPERGAVHVIPTLTPLPLVTLDLDV
jgi:hypothetical protein